MVSHTFISSASMYLALSPLVPPPFARQNHQHFPDSFPLKLGININTPGFKCPCHIRICRISKRQHCRHSQNKHFSNSHLQCRIPYQCPFFLTVVSFLSPKYRFSIHSQPLSRADFSLLSIFPACISFKNNCTVFDACIADISSA